MNRVVAYSVLSAEFAGYRQLAYEQLVALVGGDESVVRRGEVGLDYTVEIAVRWRAIANGDVAVSGTVTPADWGSPHDRLDESFVVSSGTSGSA